MTLWMLMLFFSAASLLRQTFEDGTSGWVAAGANGAIRLTHEPAEVKNGSGALAFDYTVGGGVAIAALPLNGMSLAQMDTIRFWMKTDMPTGIAIILREKRPGGDYAASCWSIGDTWQLVELRPSDFHLNEGPRDQPDPDGKLDLDQVDGFGIADIHASLGGRLPPNAPPSAPSHAGKHTLYIDDFELLSGSGGHVPVKSAIDDFSTAQLQWFTVGGIDFKPEGQGIRAIYQQMDERNAAMIRQIGVADLSGSEYLAFDISSQVDAQLAMTFEVRAPGKPQGPRYNAIVEVPGDGKVAHREVLLSAFEHGPDSPVDPNGDLDLGRIKTFTITDITGLSTHETVKNSLWIGNIHGVKAPVSQ